MATPENKKQVKADNVSKSNEKQKAKKDNKSAKQKSVQPKKNRVKETVSELKRVTWPTFGKVVKNTGIVLGMVLFFTLVLFGIDRLLSWIYGLLV